MKLTIEIDTEKDEEPNLLLSLALLNQMKSILFEIKHNSFRKVDESNWEERVNNVINLLHEIPDEALD